MDITYSYRTRVTSYSVNRGVRTLNVLIDSKPYVINWRTKRGPLLEFTAMGYDCIDTETICTEDTKRCIKDITNQLKMLAGPDQMFFGSLITPADIGFEKVLLSFQDRDVTFKKLETIAIR